MFRNNWGLRRGRKLFPYFLVSTLIHGRKKLKIWLKLLMICLCASSLKVFVIQIYVYGKRAWEKAQGARKCFWKEIIIFKSSFSMTWRCFCQSPAVTICPMWLLSHFHFNTNFRKQKKVSVPLSSCFFGYQWKIVGWPEEEDKTRQKSTFKLAFFRWTFSPSFRKVFCWLLIDEGLPEFSKILKRKFDIKILQKICKWIIVKLFS